MNRLSQDVQGGIVVAAVVFILAAMISIWVALEFDAETKQACIKANPDAAAACVHGRH